MYSVCMYLSMVFVIAPKTPPVRVWFLFINLLILPIINRKFVAQRDQRGAIEVNLVKITIEINL